MDLFNFAKRNDPPVEAEPIPQETKTPARVVVKKDKPFLDSDGGLVIPFECDKKYHWWAGGQSVKDTLKEIVCD
ncbi:MAG: hypothetical protein AAB356_06350 [Deltaproteobacteria bacterium]